MTWKQSHTIALECRQELLLQRSQQFLRRKRQHLLDAGLEFTSSNITQAIEQANDRASHPANDRVSDMSDGATDTKRNRIEQSSWQQVPDSAKSGEFNISSTAPKCHLLVSPSLSAKGTTRTCLAACSCCARSNASPAVSKARKACKFSSQSTSSKAFITFAKHALSLGVSQTLQGLRRLLPESR